MKKTILIFGIIFTFFYINAFPKTNIMILNSYHKGFSWTDNIDDAIINNLKNNNDITFYIQNMDTKRKYDEPYIEALVNMFIAKYTGIKMDYLISTDDAAFKFFIDYRNRLFGNIPLIFTGINDFYSYDLSEFDNYTGIIEDVDIGATFDLIEKIHPETKTLYVINDMYVETSKVIKRDILNIASDYPFEIKFLENVTISDLERILSTLSKDSVVYVGLFFADRDKNFTDETEINRLIADYCVVPAYTSWDIYFGSGTVGGLITHGTLQGNEAYKMLDKIIKGTPISDLPVISSPKSYYFDDFVLKKFNINRNLLPEGSVIINENPGFFQKYYKIIITISSVILILIAIIIIMRIDLSKKKKLIMQINTKNEEIAAYNQEISAYNQDLTAQNDELNNLYSKISLQKNLLQTIIDSIPHMIFAKNKNGEFLFLNQATTKYYESTTEELIKHSHYEIHGKISKTETAYIISRDAQVLSEKKKLDDPEESFTDVKGNTHILDMKKYYIEVDTETDITPAVLGVAVDVTELKKSNLALEKTNKDLNTAFLENERLIGSLENLIEIFFYEFENFEDLLRKIFLALPQFIKEYSKGAVMLFENNTYRFIEGNGYNIENLNYIRIKDIPQKESRVFITENMYNEFENYMSKEDYKIFLESVPHSKLNLNIKIKSNKKFYGIITIDLGNNYNNFSNESIRFCNYFAGVVKLYLSISEYSRDINESYINFSNKFAMIAEAYDEDTKNHINRVGSLSGFIAEKLNLAPELIKDIKTYSPLYDIGKIYIPLDILKKPGKLTPEEWEIMKKHTSYAFKLLGNNEYFNTALNIALYHHEKYDGSGYPFGLSEKAIPVEASIVSVVDVYDALRSKRPYKEAFSHEKTMDIIINGDERTSPKHFNPHILEVLKNNSDEIKNLWDVINTDL